VLPDRIFELPFPEIIRGESGNNRKIIRRKHYMAVSLCRCLLP